MLLMEPKFGGIYVGTNDLETVLIEKLLNLKNNVKSKVNL